MISKKAKNLILYFALLLSVSFAIFNTNFAIADDDEDDEDFAVASSTITYNDPFEGFNRKMFVFNGILHYYVIKPIADVYGKVPIEIRFTLNNISSNYVDTPFDMLYSVLDFDAEAFLTSFWRFALNTSFGFFGVDDVANLIGLSAHRKSLDNIFHFYHIPRGPYLMLPVFGAGTLRSASASMFNFILTSAWLVRYMGMVAWANALATPSVPFVAYMANPKISVASWTQFSMYGLSYFNKFVYIGDIKSDIAIKSEDPYSMYRMLYYKDLDESERKYDDARWNGKVKNYNICNNDWEIEEHPECEYDPKTYSTFVSENNK